MSLARCRQRRRSCVRKLAARPFAPPASLTPLSGDIERRHLPPHDRQLMATAIFCIGRRCDYLSSIEFGA